MNQLRGVSTAQSVSDIASKSSQPLDHVHHDTQKHLDSRILRMNAIQLPSQKQLSRPISLDQFGLPKDHKSLSQPTELGLISICL